MQFHSSWSTNAPSLTKVGLGRLPNVELWKLDEDPGRVAVPDKGCKMYNRFRRKRILLMVGLGCSLILVGAGFRAFHIPEPVYQGKKLRLWLEETVSLNPQTRERAESAIQEMGTNALPALVRMINTRDAAWKNGIAAALRPLKVNVPSPRLTRAQALWGFQQLRSEAKPAVPQLVRLLEDERCPEQVAEALDEMGPHAATEILALVADRKRPLAVRKRVAEGLTKMTWTWPETVAQLIASLRHRDPQVREAAVLCLAQSTSPSRDIIAGVSSTLEDDDPRNRMSAAEALVNFESRIPGSVRPDVLARAQRVLNNDLASDSGSPPGPETGGEK